MKRKRLFIIANLFNMLAVGLVVGKMAPEIVVPVLLMLSILVPVLVLKSFCSGKRANA